MNDQIQNSEKLLQDPGQYSPADLAEAIRIRETVKHFESLALDPETPFPGHGDPEALEAWKRGRLRKRTGL